MFYQFAKLVFRILFFFFFWKVRGKENLPMQGPVVVIANHRSYWDPIIVGVALKRRVYFMAKEELFSIPVLGTLVRWLGAFPVKRGQKDRAALRRALELLARGEVVGVFPEGGRNRKEGLREFEKGAALLALKAKAPILPVAVIGSPWQRLFPRGKKRLFEVRVGAPLFFEGDPKTQNLAFVSQKAQEAVQKLLGTQF